MFDLGIMAIAFEKAAASRDQFAIPQSRKGRRPMSVETMLRKDREGTLYKHAEAGLGVPGSLALKRRFMTKGASETWWAGFDDEIAKMGQDPNQVSWWEARRALKSYKRLQEETPNPRNVAGYAAMGALISPTMMALKSPIEGKAPTTPGAQAFKDWQASRFGAQTPVPAAKGPLTFKNAPQRAVNSVRRAGLGGSKARKYLASSLGGAAFMGAMPFVRHQVDKKMQERTLKKYMKQQQAQQQPQQVRKAQLERMRSVQPSGLSL